MHADDNLSESDLKKIFETAGFQYSKETISCCFIFLLKKGKNLLHIHKNDLKEFVRESVGKAQDLSMTGSKFPLETELIYSSDSYSDMADDLQREEAEATSNSFKSSDAANKVNKN